MIICVDHIVQFDDSSDEILEATSLYVIRDYVNIGRWSSYPILEVNYS